MNWRRWWLHLLHCCVCCLGVCAPNMIRCWNYGGCWTTLLWRQSNKSSLRLCDPTSLCKYWKRRDFFSASGLNPIISQINDQEDSSRLIWWVWSRICGSTSCWIRSPCQGNVITKTMETTRKTIMERAAGLIFKQMGKFTMLSQF